MIPFFSKDEEVAIISAIQEAEKRTSGEIRVHVESKPRGETMDLAVRTFHRLKMHQTKERNGVLIFLAPERRAFAIIGDEGINARVPDGFWNEVSHTMEHHFREHAFAKGVCAAIHLAGEKLQAYFPYAADDENELPDHISKA